jgi:hypothetical protein
MWFSPTDWAMTQNNLGGALVSLGERQPGAEGLRSLSGAVEAYRAALQVYTRAAMPQDWAATQNSLGYTLSKRAGRQSGAESLQSLRDAAVACRSALEVYTREEQPLSWAATQDSLGYALVGLGERQTGAEGVENLEKAVESFRLATEVYTRDTRPEGWAEIQDHLGRALQVLIPREGFVRGLDRIDRLANADGLRDDPVAQASLRAMAVYSDAASGRDAEARRALAELVGLVERQKGDFRLVWKWSTLRASLAESKEPVVVGRREGLSKLLDALEPGRDRDALRADLKRLAGAFPGPGAGAAK